MTFSIVARSVAASPDGPREFLGVAVASKFLAVGSAVPAAAPGAGAIATQSLANLRYRPDGLDLLGQGRDATSVLQELTAADPMQSWRQAGIVDSNGGSATFTGSDCFPWAGGCSGPGYAIQGNILTGPEVVDQMAQAWLASTDLQPLARRLLGALAAGDRAGGDRRGRQSAALLVVTPGGGYGGGSDVLIDLRVDDHPDPVTELARLLALHDLYFTRPDPQECLALTGELADEVRHLLSTLGWRNPDLEVALHDMAGVENLEERMVPGRIDPVVLGYLRTRAAQRQS